VSDTPTSPWKIPLALAAVVALAGALLLLFWAAFPYFYAESGSARYASEHRAEAILQVIGAAVLLWIAWLCIRRSLSPRTWLIIVALLLLVGAHSYLRSYTRMPDNIRPAGGHFYVQVESQPREIDTVMYTLYYKRGPHYQRVADLVSEYRFVAPDCVSYRGLTAVRRPMLAMCGYRVPVETYDTTTTEEELLRRARLSGTFAGRFP